LGTALLVASVGAPVFAQAQEVEPDKPAVVPVPVPVVVEVVPSAQAARDRQQAQALRDEARKERDKLTTNPDLLREYITYQYTGDDALTPRVKAVLDRAREADTQARALEEGKGLPPATER
jgi:hypothetical protein